VEKADNREKEILDFMASRDRLKSLVQINAGDWIRMKEPQKALSIRAMMNSFQEIGVTIQKSPDFYVTKINDVDLHAPEIQGMSIKDLLEIIANSNADFSDAKTSLAAPSP